ncbi:MAG TPA: co-chaperone GroES [Acidobacteriota bacterium]|jgi:chaperonin GroES
MGVNITPVHDRILARRTEQREEEVRGGIIIPDSAKEKPMEAEVIAVGKGKLLEDGRRVPIEVQAGDRVLIGKYAGSEVKLNGDEYVILREDEILGVIK